MQLFFKALNDDTRRKILEMLRDRDMNAGEIAEAFDMTKPSISHHLDLLRQAELISSIKRGQYVVYSINTTLLDEVIEWIITLKQNKT
jgi:ArsR family transcriptional regulator, arsenate/arsenite/antimonite-responsive transcriptional repressor